MKISEAWLREWVSPDLSVEQLARQLTMAGLEVDSVEPVAEAPSGVVVGEVLSVDPHPDADRLRVCTVSNGEDTQQVVCGAPNVAAGMRVPFAQVGAKLAGGMKIKKAKLRGVESHGMLMSAAELGLAEESEGLLPLAADETVGAEISAVLGLDDHVLEVELTPNRGDCLGVRGLAREVAVLNDLPVTAPVIEPVPATIDDEFAVKLSAPEGCPRYLARVIRGVDLSAPTPLWMAERLRRSGIRCIDPAVDITNYVLLELGQPMHAFDLAQLSGGIDVRMAQPGERLTLLDGTDAELREDTLLITDGNGPVAMAGVMGGERSGVTPGQTRDLLLECAFFSPQAIAGRPRAYGLNTDAGHRYERGVDPELQHLAIERATQLVLEIAGGQAGPVVEALNEACLPERQTITLRASRIALVLGMDVPHEVVDTILGRLDLPVLSRETPSADEVVWTVQAPSHRFDLSREEDLIEEVCRIHGYDRVPSAQPVTELSLAPSTERHTPLRALRTTLVELGYHEAITWSFIDPELNARIDPDGTPPALVNPMASDQSVMRTTLWPGLLRTAEQNLNRQQGRVRIFEVGRCFSISDGVIAQSVRIGGLIAGDLLEPGWHSESRGVDFYDLKGDVERLLEGVVGELELKRSGHPSLHPGQSVEVLVDGASAGHFGRIHPSLQRELDIGSDLYLFELDVALISPRSVTDFEPISRFPAVRRDLALLVDVDLPAERLLGSVRKCAGETLADLRLFDVYAGQGIDSNKKSIGLGLTLQDASRTLTDAEVQAVIDKVLVRLQDEFGVSQR